MAGSAINYKYIFVYIFVTSFPNFDIPCLFAVERSESTGVDVVMMHAAPDRQCLFVWCYMFSYFISLALLLAKQIDGGCPIHSSNILMLTVIFIYFTF